MTRDRILGLMLAALALLFVIALVPWERYPFFESAMATTETVLSKPFLHAGLVSVSPAFLLEAIAFLLLLAFVARKRRRLLRVYVLNRLNMDAGHKYALETTAEYTMVAVGLAVGLATAGLDLSSLALIGGALGIGVGFGLQPIVSNFVSGLVLLFDVALRRIGALRLRAGEWT